MSRRRRTASNRSRTGSPSRVIGPHAPSGTGPVAPGAAGKSALLPALPAGDAAALVVTHRFETPAEGSPYAATVRLRGRLVGEQPAASGRRQFLQEEAVDAIRPGAGPVTLTSWIYDLAPGDWVVEAELASGSRVDGARPRVERAAWSWRRWRALPQAPGPIHTRGALLAPLAAQPAVAPGAYPVLAVLAFAAGLLVQALVVSRAGLPPFAALPLTFLAIAVGLLAAKAWYAILNPSVAVLSGGWAVDGFLVVMPVVAALAFHLGGLPVGAVLDATAPGIFLGVAIGRVGCFFSGCCAGRPTASAFGIWSSDRRVGMRRVPTQLVEAATGLGLAAMTLLAIGAGWRQAPGLLFALSYLAYVAARQGLLRLRVERRRVPRTIPLTAAASVLAVVGTTVASVLHGG